jgi:IS1 family transposase
MDELCISTKRNLWLWTAISRSTRQVLAFTVGDRSARHVRTLLEALPPLGRRRRIYTDGYPAYASVLASWRHCIADKGDGRTSGVEGVNTSLRHRCSFLVRRHCGLRPQGLVVPRATLSVRDHNAAGVIRAEPDPGKLSCDSVGA